MSRSIVVLVGLVLVVAFADSAFAGPFRRIWERRKAELGGELNASLSAKLDADLARESKAVEGRLSEANKAQIADEAKMLQGEVTAEVAALRQQALEQLTAEAKKIQKESRQL